MSIPVSPSVTRQAVLKLIDRHFQQVAQWARLGDFPRAAEYQAKTEALVELLEIDDCGSSGGYDRKRNQPNPSTLAGQDRLSMRINWLKAQTEHEPTLAGAR